jgi:peptide/nickel transport system substrate-binding protein
VIESRRISGRSGPVVAAVLTAVLVLAAACGGNDTDDTATQPTVGRDATDVTVAPEGAPQTGGRLVYALEAESDGFNPATNRFAPAGTLVGLAIFDPLAAFDADLNVEPYVAESFAPNDDFTEWTITAREDITFHNGTPLDGEAMAKFFEALRADALVGIAFTNIESVEADPDNPLAVVLTMERPWASFPVFLTGQAGMIAAPEMLDDPEGGRNPIGTGPFTFSSWIPDSRLVLEKNQNYWRIDDNGVQLPYLDQVEFRPIPDTVSRDASLETGDVQIMHTTEPRSFKKFSAQAAQGRVQILYDRAETEEGFIMLNTAVPPFDDIRARQALAYATDRELYNDIVNEGLRETADSIFREGSRWRGEPTYPDFDQDRARELVAEYEADHGPLQFALVNSGTDDRGIVFLQEQWAAVGIQAEVRLVDQAQFILDAAVGNFQAFQWRQFGAPDPDYDYLWWHSENANPPGEGLSLNFARNENPDIDAALEEGRSADDPDLRLDAYQRVEQLINDDVPYIWLDRAEWAVIAKPNVRGITNGPLPSGSAAFPIGGPGGFGSVTFLTQTWLAP